MSDYDENLGALFLSLLACLLNSPCGVGYHNGAETVWEDQSRCLGVGDANDCDLDAVHLEDLVRFDTVEFVVDVLQVRRDVGEISNVDHLLKMVDAFVEVVVPESVDIESHQVHGLHRGYLVEERRQRQRCSERVAGRERQCVRVVGAFLREVCRQLCRTAKIA